MLLKVFGLLVFIALLFPDTPAGKFLHRVLVERTVAWLSTVTLSRFLICLVACLAFVALLYIAVPIDVALIGAGDWAAYFEVASAVWALGAHRVVYVVVTRVSVTLKAGLGWVRRRNGVPAGRPQRRRRDLKPRGSRSPFPSDDGDWVFA